MSNFFEKVATDVDNVEENMLGPDYEYYKHIRSPGELGASSDGSMGAMAKDVGAIVNYVELLVAGGGAASKTGKRESLMPVLIADEIQIIIDV